MRSLYSEGIRRRRPGKLWCRSFMKYAAIQSLAGPIEASLKGGDPAAGSPTATLLRLHPSR